MSDDCELPQYYNCQMRRARKGHKCCECSAPIDPGEHYLEVRACWENRPDVFRQHILCETACEFVRDSGINMGQCVYYGGLQEWYREFIKDGYHVGKDIEDRKKIWRYMLGIRRRERKYGRVVL